jgi:hypothetical protein
MNNHRTKNVQRSIVCMVQTFTAKVVTLQTALLRDYRRTTAVVLSQGSKADALGLPYATYNINGSLYNASLPQSSLYMVS